MSRCAFAIGVLGFVALLFSTFSVGCSGGDTKSGTDGGAATGGQSGASGGSGGRTGGAGGGINRDGGPPDAFNLDGLDFDAIAADLGITSCAGTVSNGAPCTSAGDQACRPASGGNICVCQSGGTWMCF